MSQRDVRKDDDLVMTQNQLSASRAETQLEHCQRITAGLELQLSRQPMEVGVQEEIDW